MINTCCDLKMAERLENLAEKGYTPATEGYNTLPPHANAEQRSISGFGKYATLAVLLASLYGCANYMEVKGTANNPPPKAPNSSKYKPTNKERIATNKGNPNNESYYKIQLGKKPKKVKGWTIPFYLIRPTKFLFIDGSYFTKFAHEIDGALRNGGLEQALNDSGLYSQSPELAKEIYDAACVKYSQRDLSKSLKQLDKPQIDSLTKSLENVLSKEPALQKYKLNVAVKKGLHPWAKEGISLIADSTILYFEIRAIIDAVEGGKSSGAGETSTTPPATTPPGGGVPPPPPPGG